MKERRMVVCFPAASASSPPLSRVHHSGIPRFAVTGSASRIGLPIVSFSAMTLLSPVGGRRRSPRRLVPSQPCDRPSRTEERGSLVRPFGQSNGRRGDLASPCLGGLHNPRPTSTTTILGAPRFQGE